MWDDPGTVSLNTREDLLILVDRQDRELGFETKQKCHQGEGLLHRAFSVFLFNADGAVLVQRRAAAKPLWPGYWSNACCSHPRKGETVAAAAQRRLAEELSLAPTPLERVFAFEYFASYGEAGSERELCHVLFGRVDQAVKANPDEVSEWVWRDRAALERALATSPDRFTPWFKLEWDLIRKRHGHTLSRFTAPLAACAPS